MCLILFAYQMHPKYRLVLAANRDEFYNRPTDPLKFWENCPNILAGCDLRQNGTWLGITRNGRLAAVTNYRIPFEVKTDARSRGLLVREFLESEIGPEKYLETLLKSIGHYKGFNLIVADTNGIYYLSNQTGKYYRVNSGYYGLSNRLLDTPWPKVVRGKHILKHIVKTQQNIDPETIFDMLSDTWKPSDCELPDTGVGIEWERLLAPVFVQSPHYGTRSSSVILWENSGTIQFSERTFDSGKPHETRSFTYSSDS
jgi:uncharacterized protein with NRDE domain